MSKQNITEEQKQMIKELKDVDYFAVETDPVVNELVNAFIKEAVPNLFPHYVDNDENAGQKLRVQLDSLLQKEREAGKREGIEMFIDVEKSQNKNRLVVGWTNPDQSVGGYLDVTDLFFSIRNYWESTIRRDEEKTTDKPYVVNLAGSCPDVVCKHKVGEHD